jgi:hypothetical protein
MTDQQVLVANAQNDHGCVWQLLAIACCAAFDYWTNLVTMRSACFTSQYSAKLIAKLLQRADLLIDFL